MRGRGIGLALVRWLVGLAFDELGLHRLELVVLGHVHHARRASNGYWDLIYMALLESWRRGD